MADSPVRVSVTLVHATERAILAQSDLDLVATKQWVPKSQVLNLDEIDFEELAPGEDIILEVPQWLAKAKNWKWV